MKKNDIEQALRLLTRLDTLKGLLMRCTNSPTYATTVSFHNTLIDLPSADLAAILNTAISATQEVLKDMGVEF